MSNTETMPLMMALRMAPIPFTTAIRQAPIDWKTALICRWCVSWGERGWVVGGGKF